MTPTAAPRKGAPLILLGALAMAGLSVAGCDVQVGDKGVSVDFAQGKATEDWTRTYTLAKGGRLEIVNLNGAIQAEPSSGSTIEIRAHREAKAGSDDAARRLLAEAKMAEDVAPDHVRVEVQRPTNGSIGFGRSVSVQYDVHVPPGLIVSLRTQNGAVRLQNVRGTITAGTTNGSINGEELAGAVTASTVNGGVNLAFSDINGDVDARTVNGGIRIELPPDANASIDASVVNGGVSVDDTLNLTATNREPRHITGTLNRGGPRISAQTTNGGVRIYGTAREVRGLRGR